MKTLLTVILFFAATFCGGDANAGDINFDTIPDVEDTTDEVEESRKSYQTAAGIGLGVLPEYEGSEDYFAVPVPYFRVHWQSGRYLELQAVKLRANLVPQNIIKAGPILRYHMGRKDVENDTVDELRDIDGSLMLGGYCEIDIDRWDAGIELVTDVTDEHDGTLFTLKGGYTFPLETHTNLRLGALTTYADDDYMESFFAIDADNAARSGLRTYDADGGLKDIGLSASFFGGPQKNGALYGRIFTNDSLMMQRTALLWTMKAMPLSFFLCFYLYEVFNLSFCGT